jgi:hypothetical protein
MHLQRSHFFVCLQTSTGCTKTTTVTGGSGKSNQAWMFWLCWLCWLIVLCCLPQEVLQQQLQWPAQVHSRPTCFEHCAA